jgi:hypothetical protein
LHGNGWCEHNLPGSGEEMADCVSRIRELLSCCVGRWYDHLEMAEAELKRDETQRRDSLPLDQVSTIVRDSSLGLAAGDVANAD